MFRPCIDLHAGKVKQIVGGTLSDSRQALVTHFESLKPPAYYAELFKKHQLTGGHVIRLGEGNEEASLEALGAYPGGLQVGGGISSANACIFLDAGASHVIVTSWLFENKVFSFEKLKHLSDTIGKDKLVVDLSCRKREGQYVVMTHRWQTFTENMLSKEWVSLIEPYCSELLIHAVDVEGLCRGIDVQLVTLLKNITTLPVTYAGGAKSIDDLRLVESLGEGRIHLTIGSALDIFGGTGVKFTEAVAFNKTIELKNIQHS